MVICLERCAGLHTAQLMPLPLTVSCFSKIQIGFTFLVPAYLGSPGQRAVKLGVCAFCTIVQMSSTVIDLVAVFAMFVLMLVGLLLLCFLVLLPVFFGEKRLRYNSISRVVSCLNSDQHWRSYRAVAPPEGKGGKASPCGCAER